MKVNNADTALNPSEIMSVNSDSEKVYNDHGILYFAFKRVLYLCKSNKLIVLNLEFIYSCRHVKKEPY